MVTRTALPPSPLNGWSSEFANHAMPATISASTARAIRRPGPRRPRFVRLPPGPPSRPAAAPAAGQAPPLGEPVATLLVARRGVPGGVVLPARRRHRARGGGARLGDRGRVRGGAVLGLERL